MSSSSQASTPQSSPYRGLIHASTAYLLWGVFPLFWKLLKNVDATELIAHRIVWSLLFVALVTTALKGWPEMREAVKSKKLLLIHTASGVLVTINWLVYVWGINHDRVVECSIGYFLVPLCNVTMGRLFLKEHLRPMQWVAIGVAAVAVALQFMNLDSVPYVALTLTVSWSLYALLRKQSPLSSLPGLTLETALLSPFAIGFLIWRGVEGTGALGHVAWWQQLVILSAGVVTAVPLLLFASGARSLRLSTIGLLQYIGPSITFVLGVYLYHEPVARERLLSFILIWSALVIYTADNMRASGKSVSKS